jgi:RNA polymerase sigma-70 factor (ECF subfamily)
MTWAAASLHTWFPSARLARLRGWGVGLRRLILFLSDHTAPAEGWGVPTEDLIRRFQQGQPRAFEALYERFKDMVYRIAFFTTRHSGEAEEAVQETFMDVMRALPDYQIDGPARFETWLYRVTVNRCRSRMRRKRLPTADWDDMEERLERLPSPHAEEDPQRVVLRRERAVALWRTVDALPEGQRVVVLLRYRQGLSYSEIAQVLNIPEGTVKSRLYHAHRTLHDRLPLVAEGLMPAEVEV